MRIGLTRRLPLDAKKILAPCFETVTMIEKERPLFESERMELVRDQDVLICQLTDKITEELLVNASELKHISTFSTGVDHLNLAELKKRRISVSHTPGVLTEATANLAWALILDCARRLRPAEKFLKEGKFKGFFPSLFLGIPLEKAVLGIIGMGNIGQAVARRARAFGMKVVYFSRTPKNVEDAENVPLEKLLEVSDVVSVHCPLTSETRHLFNETTLKKMKKGAVLVNTARGPIIHEEALYQHLRQHPEFFAGLDVFEKEPEVFPGLLELPNAVCVPHIGSASRWAREQMASICIQEAMRFARGEKLQFEYPL
ncbi:MAG: 2-hydroxyacid dehydrogenase [Deltaproteobacteria bacterium]